MIQDENHCYTTRLEGDKDELVKTCRLECADLFSDMIAGKNKGFSVSWFDNKTIIVRKV